MTTSLRFGSALLLLMAGTGLIAVLGIGTSPAPAPGAESIHATSPAIARGQALIARAARAGDAGRIASPPGDNATELYLAARAQLPANAAVRDALARLEPMLAQAARAALNQGENEEARRVLALLEQAAPASSESQALRSELEGLRAAAPVAASAKPRDAHTSPVRGGGAVGRSPAAL